MIILNRRLQVKTQHGRKCLMLPFFNYRLEFWPIVLGLAMKSWSHLSFFLGILLTAGCMGDKLPLYQKSFKFPDDALVKDSIR